MPPHYTSTWHTLKIIYPPHPHTTDTKYYTIKMKKNEAKKTRQIYCGTWNLATARQSVAIAGTQPCLDL